MRRVSWIVMASLGIGSVASAAPSYRDALSDGRKKLAAKDYAGAAAAFKQAVAAKPDDAVAVAELSWASLLAGDFVGAEASALEATWSAKDPKVRASVFYNLGRAREAQGKLNDAEAAYTTSLSLRDNAEIKGRLKAIAAALLTPRALVGPFATPDGYCKDQHLDRDHCEVVLDIDHKRDETNEEVHDAAGKPVRLVAPPFQAVAKILTDAQPAISFSTANLALEVGGKWYVLPSLGEAPGGHGGDYIIGLRMVGPRLAVDWSNAVGRFGHIDETKLIACGVAADHTPRCAGPIVTSRIESTDPCGKDPDCTKQGSLNIAFRCAGSLRGDVLEVGEDPSKLENVDGLRVVRAKPNACAQLPAFGKHALAF